MKILQAHNATKIKEASENNKKKRKRKEMPIAEMQPER